ncbi:MAG: 2-isopropylmalate synthase [Candidatus Altiarchaeales archaeon IMC4]|nr:MAG: 2-isopropylmalate synthase [Candidatus Altiarchaeales archaeon IMC4]
MAKIKVLDTTLRDGEQTPGVSLTVEKKVEIAQALDRLGVDVIEAGAAITSEGEREGIKKIAGLGLNAEISSFARILKNDIDLAMGCDVDSIFLVAPTSDLHIKYKLGITREELLDKVSESVEYCKSHGLLVDLCCEDGSRTDTRFLNEVLKAVEKKIDRFTIADTVGISTPEKIAEMFSKIKTKKPLGVHCHDDMGLATANTISAVRAGAGVVDVTINGLGERAGNAPLEEVIMALKLGYAIESNIKTCLITATSELVEKLCNISVQPNKAIVGDNAFTHEAGIHVDGILKNPKTYESIDPRLVGARRRFVLGKHAGIKAVKKILEDMQIVVTENEISEIFNRVKFIGDKGKKVTSADIETIANSVKGVETKKALKLVELVAIAGNKFTPVASVKLLINGNEVIQSGTGDGPVDAALSAIRNATKDVPFELMEYHVDAVSGGTDALVRIEVKLKSRGKIVTAQGSGSDIVLASVDAMINGLNTIMK